MKIRAAFQKSILPNPWFLIHKKIVIVTKQFKFYVFFSNMYFWFSLFVLNSQRKKRCFASQKEALVLPSQVDPVSRKQIENISTPSQSSLSCQPLFFFFPSGPSRLYRWHQNENSSPEPACRCCVSLCWWGFSSIVWRAWPRGFYCWISVVRMIQTLGKNEGSVTIKRHNHSLWGSGERFTFEGSISECWRVSFFFFSQLFFFPRSRLAASPIWGVRLQMFCS